jgi:translation initiation factor eIF-2B subunit gamma
VAKPSPPPFTNTHPKGVDYLGLDPTHRLLLFSASHPDALRDLKVPLAAVMRHGAVELRSDLIDHHLYVLSRSRV